MMMMILFLLAQLLMTTPVMTTEFDLYEYIDYEDTTTESEAQLLMTTPVMTTDFNLYDYEYTDYEDFPTETEDSPRDVMVVISPTDPVSVGSLVNLTCSTRGNPPVDHFIWILVSDGKLDLILDSTQVYSFNVTSSDRGRWYYCVCSRGPHMKVSPGRQLIFEGDHQSGLVGVEAIVKILGIITLVGTVVIFECWFRSRCSTKPVKDAVEADYINRVIESRAL